MSQVMGLDGGYDPAAEAHFARMATAGSAPDSARRAAINDVVVALKTAGVWALGNHLALVGGPTQAASLLDLFNSFDLSVISGGTFVADRGWTAGGSGALATGFIPNTQISSISDFSIGIFQRGTVSSAAAFAAGCDDGTNYLLLAPLYSPDDQAVVGLNKTAGAAYRFGSTAASLSSPFTLGQKDFNNAEAYRNGVALSRSGTAGGSNGKPTTQIYFGGYNANGTASPLAYEVFATWIGKALTAPQALALYTALAAYMTAVGA